MRRHRHAGRRRRPRRRCSTRSSRRSRRRTGDPDAPLQALVTTLDASEYLGRLAIGRVVQRRAAPGRDRGAARGGVRRGPDRRCSAGSSQLMAFTGVGRDEVDELSRRRPVHRRRVPRGRDRRHDRRRPSNPVALPRLIVDEPVLRMTFGVNTSPLAGKDGGKFLTSRHLRRPPRPRDPRQRVDQAARDRVARRHRGRRPWRAAARRAHRGDAPRGLRAAGQPARGHHQGSQRQALRAARAGRVRRARRARRHRHPGARAAQGPGHRPAPRRRRPHDRHVRVPEPRAASASARCC